MKRPKNKRETENGYGPNKMLLQEQKTESTEHISCLKHLQPGNFRMIGTVNPRGGSLPWSYGA